MRRGFTAVACLACLVASAAADMPAEVDQDEVRRLGSVVQRVGDGRRSTEVDTFVQIMGPPADDNDKWFISVVTMQGCAPCAKLKKDWQTDPWLRSLAKPEDPKTSWAHLNFYDKDDKSQAWRFEKIKISAYPTIVVQPPRSGKYGDPTTVVYQNTYGGDPQALASAITAAIRRYVATLPQPRQADGSGQKPDTKPPWQPPPKIDPPLPPDVRPVDPVIPPDARPSVAPRSLAGDAVLVLGGLMLPLAIGGAIYGLKYVRAQRVQSGKPLLLDDSSMEQLLKFLQLLQALAEARIKLPETPIKEAEPAKKAA